MRLQELGVDYKQANDELSIWPECAFVDKQAAIAFTNEARGPGLGSPSRIQVLFQKQSELIGIGHGNDLYIAPFVVRLQAVLLQPIAQCDVLRVPELRRRDPLPVKVLWLVDSGIGAHD